MPASITNLESLLKEEFKESAICDINRIESLHGDASFRSYYRLFDKQNSYILMDSRNDTSIASFINVSDLLLGNKVRVPKILSKSRSQRMLILEDFGDTLLGNIVSPGNIEPVYDRACLDLAKFANINVHNHKVKVFDEKMLYDHFNLFLTWFVEAYCKNMNRKLHRDLQNSFLPFFTKSLDSCPKVFVHMDFHSRNILLCEDGTLGILDFQDATYGPIGYDAASLWQDAYREFDSSMINKWAHTFQDHLSSSNTKIKISTDTLLHYTYLFGLQRHLKNLGIFARLKLKYGKSGYEQYIPQLLKYIKEISPLFPQISSATSLVEEAYHSCASGKIAQEENN